jgi:DNA-binding transcriptional MerR regulator
MPSDLHVRDLIIQLKAIKEEQGFSISQIYDMLEANNYHVSLNSIKKVFSDGSENQHFQFHNTLQPISRVLLGIYGENHGNSEIDGLRADIQVKDELIERREAELASCREEYARRTEFLLQQIELKDKRIDLLMGRVDVLLVQLQKLVDRCNNCPHNP